MRGKPALRRGLRVPKRITPADAGKTQRTAYNGLRNEDHPRGCGENIEALPQIINSIGSPPRMRGKPPQSRFSLPCCGITPADAGKTEESNFGRKQFEDHPRGCGENTLRLLLHLRLRGSPPRMRGKRIPKHGEQSHQGITPADAGKTLKRSFRNQPFCSRAVQISFNFSNSLNVSLQSGSAR